MEANLNAFGIILAPVIAIAASLIWGTKYDERRFIKAVLIPLSIIIALVIILSLLPSDLHLYVAYQLFLPVICLFPVLWFVEKKNVRYSVSAVLLILAISLSIQYEYLIHSRVYSSTRGKIIIAQNNFQRLSVSMMLYDYISRDSNSYPEGWLSESPILNDFSGEHQKNLKEQCVFNRPQTSRLWHTSFTHIYAAKEQHFELWYPGGNLSEKTLEKISLRER
jgi:hypothetical protein